MRRVISSSPSVNSGWAERAIETEIYERQNSPATIGRYFNPVTNNTVYFAVLALIEVNTREGRCNGTSISTETLNN